MLRELQPTCNHSAWGETPTQASVPMGPLPSLGLVNWEELHNNADGNADKNMKHLNVITQSTFKLCALCPQSDFYPFSFRCMLKNSKQMRVIFQSIHILKIPNVYSWTSCWKVNPIWITCLLIDLVFASKEARIKETQWSVLCTCDPPIQIGSPNRCMATTDVGNVHSVPTLLIQRQFPIHSFFVSSCRFIYL